MKKLIGLGCSWTVGEGAYPNEIWQQYNGNCRAYPATENDYFFRPYALENSWVSVLCRDYLPNYAPVNLGERGTGIRGAVNQLHLTDEVDWEHDTGIICLMLPHLSRINLFSKKKWKNYNWRTLSNAPTATLGPGNECWDDIWTKEFYDEAVACHEAALAIYTAQLFAERYNFKFIFANAYFEHCSFHDYFVTHNVNKALMKRINWSNYFPTHKEDYASFVDKLTQLDGILPENVHYFGFYQKLSWPATYLTNCCHPTLQGQKVIAKELHRFMMDNNYF